MTNAELRAISEVLTYISRHVVDIRENQKLLVEELHRMRTETRGKKAVRPTRIIQRLRYRLDKALTENKQLHELLERELKTLQ